MGRKGKYSSHIPRKRRVIFLAICISAALIFLHRYFMATPVSPLPSKGPSLSLSASSPSLDCTSVRLGEGALRGDRGDIAYWKNVPADEAYRSPRALTQPDPKYVTFELDTGGFNNVRMGFECVFAFAASTGRTLVLPPPKNIYLFASEALGIPEIFHLEKIKGRIDTMSSEEFFEVEALTGGLGIYPPKALSDMSYKEVMEYYESVSGQYQGGLPKLEGGRDMGILFPFTPGESVSLLDPRHDEADLMGWLGSRSVVEYDTEAWAKAKVIHFSSKKDSRLLAPFYTLMRHSNPEEDKYYKRLVRDTLHFRDEVLCKASQIVSMIQAAAESQGGSFSTMHIRRGDFLRQYPKVGLTAEDFLESSKSHLHENEVVYIATDERDKSFFEPLRQRYKVFFLDDFAERAHVEELPGMYASMIDSVVASLGRVFMGTWWSTYSAYIIRMRGYRGMPLESSPYLWGERKYYHTEHKYPVSPFWMTEWEQGWLDIDDF